MWALIQYSMFWVTLSKTWESKVKNYEISRDYLQSPTPSVETPNKWKFKEELQDRDCEVSHFLLSYCPIFNQQKIYPSACFLKYTFYSPLNVWCVWMWVVEQRNDFIPFRINVFVQFTKHSWTLPLCVNILFINWLLIRALLKDRCAYRLSQYKIF